MYKFNKLYFFLIPLLGIVFFSFSKDTSIKKYKCMVQLTNYAGEEAYVIVSIVDGKGKYLKTVRVLGRDDEWYPDLSAWWDFYEGKNKPNIDGITGASVAGGERSIFVIGLDDKYLNKAYKLRFETAVEDQKYFDKDLEVSLTSKNLNAKFEGSGYIRYVRMIPN